MPTDLPRVHSVVHDYSALDAHTQSVRAKAKARLYLAIGAASLAAGAGVGLGAWGLSHLNEPKIVTTERVVVQKEIEKIEIEKPIVTERLVTIEKPVVVQAAPPAEQAKPIEPLPMRAPIPKKPAAPVGSPSSENAFVNSQEFETAEIHGRIASHNHGIIQFADGKQRFDAYPDGSHDPRLSTTRHNGDYGFCRRLPGEFPNGNPRWDCRVLHRGVVENAYSANGWRTSPAPVPRQDADPISSLFN
jgi:hypothetical protein